MKVINEIAVPTFSDFYKKKRGTRQQRGYTGQTRLHQNLVPHMHKSDPSENRKVEDLRDLGNSKKVLNDQDLGFITRKYNIRNITKDRPRFLGRSGMKLYFDPHVGAWCITK